jgi:N-alpha-acetyl-L-2,4-diaminobutyrate deacetylase
MMKRGIRNLLRHLGILGSELEAVPLKLHLWGEGNIHNGINAGQRGFLIPAVGLLEEVREGQYLGRLCTPVGKTLEEYHAPCDGVIGLVREFPVVGADDPLFLITGYKNDTGMNAGVASQRLAPRVST